MILFFKKCLVLLLQKICGFLLLFVSGFWEV